MLDAVSSTAIVDGTLWTLVAFSVATWSLILIKGLQHWRVAGQNRRYGRAFWAAPDLQSAAALDGQDGPAARLADSAFSALREAEAGAHDLSHSGDRRELLERFLRKQIQRERRGLESGLAVLASIGSTSPFVGLFGTVWGIMHALTDISKAGSASLDVVAGPIGEALIATGIGIAVAVPAVLAYNFFLRRLKAVAADLDDFAHDLLNLAQRNDFRGPGRLRPVAGGQDGAAPFTTPAAQERFA